jgi:hypothetical protein
VSWDVNYRDYYPMQKYHYDSTNRVKEAGYFMKSKHKLYRKYFSSSPKDVRSYDFTYFGNAVSNCLTTVLWSVWS